MSTSETLPLTVNIQRKAKEYGEEDLRWLSRAIWKGAEQVELQKKQFVFYVREEESGEKTNLHVHDDEVEFRILSPGIGNKITLRFPIPPGLASRKSGSYKVAICLAESVIRIAHWINEWKLVAHLSWHHLPKHIDRLDCIFVEDRETVCQIGMRKELWFPVFQADCQLSTRYQLSMNAFAKPLELPGLRTIFQSESSSPPSAAQGTRSTKPNKTGKPGAKKGQPTGKASKPSKAVKQPAPLAKIPGKHWDPDQGIWVSDAIYYGGDGSLPRAPRIDPSQMPLPDPEYKRGRVKVPTLLAQQQSYPQFVQPIFVRPHPAIERGAPPWQQQIGFLPPAGYGGHH